MGDFSTISQRIAEIGTLEQMLITHQWNKSSNSTFRGSKKHKTSNQMSLF